jgi:hypothetical protein
MLTSVGSEQVSLPLVFDTGSAGVTINALGLFPSSMVNSSGFIFPEGQTSMTYEGITVEKDQQGIRTYGGHSGTTEHGNMGYAQLTFGDAEGSLTTAIMPVFLFFSVTATDGGGAVSEQTQASLVEGLFGVDTEADPTVVGTSSVQQAEVFPCSPEAIGTCSTLSAFKYLRYGNNLKAGFLLSPAALQSCDINTAGSCAPEPILTIGLTDAIEAPFSAVSLSCPPNNYNGPETINSNDLRSRHWYGERHGALRFRHSRYDSLQPA